MPSKDVEIFLPNQLNSVLGKKQTKDFFKQMSDVSIRSNIASPLIHQKSVLVKHKPNPRNILVTGAVGAALGAAFVINPFLFTFGLSAFFFTGAFKQIGNLSRRYKDSLNKLAKQLDLTYEFIVELPLSDYVDLDKAINDGIINRYNSSKYIGSRGARLFGARMSDGSMMQILIYKSFPLRVNQVVHFFKPNPIIGALDSWDTAFGSTFESISDITRTSKRDIKSIKEIVSNQKRAEGYSDYEGDNTNLMDMLRNVPDSVFGKGGKL